MVTLIPPVEDVIREIRSEMSLMGLSQSDLASELQSRNVDIDQTVISRILSRERGLQYEEAKSILDVVASHLSAIDPDMRAGKIATRRIEYAGIDELLKDVSDRMLRGRISQMPVRDEQGKLHGTLTELTLLRVLISPSSIKKEQHRVAHLRDWKVRELVTPTNHLEETPTFSPNTKLRDLAPAFEHNYAVFLKETGDEELKGILTRADFLGLIGSGSITLHPKW